MICYLKHSPYLVTFIKTYDMYWVEVQARVQEFARGGAQNLKAFFFFFFCFSIFQGGGAQLKN